MIIARVLSSKGLGETRSAFISKRPQAAHRYSGVGVSSIRGQIPVVDLLQSSDFSVAEKKWVPRGFYLRKKQTFK